MARSALHAVLLFALAAAPSVRAQTVPVPDSPERAAGCFVLEHEGWPEEHAHLPPASWLPPQLELTLEPYLLTVSAPGEELRQEPPPRGADYRAVRAEGRRLGVGTFNFWVLRDGELLVSRFLTPTGFSLRLTWSGSRWEGVLEGGTDYIVEGEEGSRRVPARLTPLPCEASDE